MKMDKSNVFFCYNKRLFTFIKDVKGIDYLTVAKHPKTDKLFAAFFKSEELQQAIDDYKKITKEWLQFSWYFYFYILSLYVDT